MRSAQTESRSARIGDTLAIGLSALCLVHCLALPVIIVALPVTGSLFGQEWVHKFFFLMALPISLWAVLRSGKWRHPDVAVPLMLGLGLLGVAAFIAALADYETILSVVGASSLAVAHWRNAQQAHRHA